eukprot:2538186-Rhodomonas_salina.1
MASQHHCALLANAVVAHVQGLYEEGLDRPTQCRAWNRISESIPSQDDILEMVVLRDPLGKRHGSLRSQHIEREIQIVQSVVGYHHLSQRLSRVQTRAVPGLVLACTFVSTCLDYLDTQRRTD